MAREKKRFPNHIDDPHEFVRTKCEACDTCWIHVSLDRCIFNGPYQYLPVVAEGVPVRGPHVAGDSEVVEGGAGPVIPG